METQATTGGNTAILPATANMTIEQLRDITLVLGDNLAYMKTLVPLVERGGYIPFCDHRCPPDVKPENYLYYLDLKEEMFGM